MGESLKRLTSRGRIVSRETRLMASAKNMLSSTLTLKFQRRLASTASWSRFTLTAQIADFSLMGEGGICRGSLTQSPSMAPPIKPQTSVKPKRL